MFRVEHFLPARMKAPGARFLFEHRLDTADTLAVAALGQGEQPGVWDAQEWRTRWRILKVPQKSADCSAASPSDA